MKAISYYEYGGVDKLVFDEVELPDLKAHEILIRVRAVSVNDFDLGMLAGKPFVVRLQNGLMKPRKTHILGSDIAGTVEAIGGDVTQFKIGDRVFGDLSDRWGGFAEYCIAGENDVEQISESLSFSEAAALPQAGALAYQGLFDYGKAQPGERVLINGAGGGVGTLGVQMGKAAKLHMDGVDTESKFNEMRRLGFENTLDYTSTDFTSIERTYDIVLDNKFNRSIFKCLKTLSPRGRYLIIGGRSGHLFKALLFSPMIRMFTGKRLELVMLKKNRGMDHIKMLHEAGQLEVVRQEHESLESGIDAITAYSNNSFTGKVIIRLK